VKLTPSDKPVAEFEVKFSEEMIAAKEIKECRIHGFNVCGECGTKSVLTELVAHANCNVHGLWEGTKLIEVKSSKSVGEGKACKWEM
jgi:superoxide reductase